MRPSSLFVLSSLIACAPESQTATVGECPEGSELSDNGDCVDIGTENTESDADEGDVNGDADDDAGNGGADENDDEDEDEDEDEESDIPEDLDPLEEDVSGKSYAIDLSTAEWVKPDTALLTGFLGDALDVKVLMSVEEATDEVLDLVGALPDTDSEELVQDTCLPTLDLDPIDFEYSPYFEVGPTDFPIDLMGVSLTIWDMNITGIFEPDGAGMYDIGMAGALDIRELGTALDGIDVPLVDLSDPDSTCDLLGSLLGIECEECPSDEEEFCIEIELDQIIADETDTEIVPITEDEIDEDCE